MLRIIDQATTGGFPFLTKILNAQEKVKKKVWGCTRIKYILNIYFT